MQLRIIIALLALSWGALASAGGDCFGDGGVPAFYQWSEPIPNPGTLLRSETLPTSLVLSTASRGERILYASTNGVDNQSRAALSGALFWPKGNPPRGAGPWWPGPMVRSAQRTDALRPSPGAPTGM